MNNDELQDIGAHLRRIHFFILVACAACIVIIFGYRNNSVESALSDLERLTSDLDGTLEITKSSTLPDLKNQWRSLNKKFKFSKAWGITPTGPSDPGTLTTPKLQMTDVDTLDFCGAWDDIERTDYENFSAQMRIKELSNIGCRWLGENHLLVSSVTISEQAEIKTLTPTGFADENISTQNYNLLKVNSAEDLSECGNWYEIDRGEYDEFIPFLENIEHFSCYWIGEDQLLVREFNLNQDDKRYIVNENNIFEWNPKNYISLGLAAARIEGNNIEQCGGVAINADMNTFRDHLKICAAIGLSTAIPFAFG